MYARILKTTEGAIAAWKVRQRHHRGKTLGISRGEMPQIRSADMPEFIEFAKKRGVMVTETEKLVSDLRATQSEVNPEQVAQMPDDALRKPLTVSADGYLLDGHNRWARLKQQDPNQKVKVVRLGLMIGTALNMMQTFPKSFHKDISEIGATKKAEDE